jgi:hypothetical protein
MFLHFHNGICDNQDASSEGQEGHLVHSQGCMVDVQDTPRQTAANRLTYVRQFGVLAPSDHLLCLLKKVTDAQLMWKCKRVSIHKAQNSTMKAYIH